LEAKQGLDCLVLGWKTDLQKRLLRDCLDTRGECHQSSNGVTRPNLSKITKAERIEEVVLMHMWLSFYFILFIFSQVAI
jgi:hypothetical protein